MNFYVLVNPDDQGMCEAKMVSKEDVFFAPKFRAYHDPRGTDSILGDTIIGTEQRRSHLPAAIRRHIELLTQTAMEKSTRPPKPVVTSSHFSVAPDINSEVVIEPEVAINHDVAINHELAMNPDKDRLEELPIIPDTRALQEMVNLKVSKFTEEAAQAVL
jgi:hypothetical protein